MMLLFYITKVNILLCLFLKTTKAGITIQLMGIMFTHLDLELLAKAAKVAEIRHSQEDEMLMMLMSDLLKAFPLF